MTNKERFELQQKIRDGFEFDRLKMYFGEPFEVADKLTIIQPTFGQIMDIGEQRFYETLSIFVSNSTGYRLPLWHLGVDWNKTTDYELFRMLYGGVDPEIGSLLFESVPIINEDGEEVYEAIDFSSFEMYGKTLPPENEDEEPKESITLYSKRQDIEIDENTYLKLSQYLRTMFNIFPKTERAKGQATKEAIIWEEEEAVKLRKDDVYHSTLLPIVSSLVNHPGFKYRLSEMRDLTMTQIMDSVQRLQVYESSTALLKGMYSGFVDGSKIKADNYNFMRDLTENI